MRTTLSLDDDLVPQVKTYAESRDITVGKAVSELVRRGLHAPCGPGWSTDSTSSSYLRDRPWLQVNISRSLRKSLIERWFLTARQCSYRRRLACPSGPPKSPAMGRSSCKRWVGNVPLHGDRIRPYSLQPGVFAERTHSRRRP